MVLPRKPDSWQATRLLPWMANLSWARSSTNQEAMRRLKGQKDTKVKIGVVRYGGKKVQTFTVTRGEIPTKSVTASYMLDDKTGYIRIKNFGREHLP